jgi:hypothetical protein
MIHWICCLVGMLSAADELTRVNQLGPVEVTTRLVPAAPLIGDEITLEIRVEAEPDVEVLMPAFGEALHRYTIVDFVPRRAVTDAGRNEYVHRYTLQPQESGAQTIAPILIEFVDNRPGQKRAPDDLDAYELLTDRMDFHVQSVLPDSTSPQLVPALGPLDLEPRATAWRRFGPAGAGVALVLTAAVLAMLWTRGRRRRVRRRNAYELARARLDALLAQSTPHDAAAVEAFFVAISGIVRRYLEDRFELRAPELTTEEFLTLAGTSRDLTREHQGLLREFLRQADLVKFAGVRVTGEDVRHSSDLAIRFLEDTRENAPWVEDGERVNRTPDAARGTDHVNRQQVRQGAKRADV